jgi:hypothetical protein
MKTKQEYIEKIRQCAVAANPSIKDLVFGCQVMDTEYGRTDIYNFGSMSDTFSFLHRENSEKQVWNSTFKEHFKIIGRKIGIADVLIAIGKNEIYKTPRGCEILQELIGLRWNLKEDLNGQSEETLKFIADLLTP